MAIGGRYVSRGESNPEELFHSSILEQLEPRLLLSSAIWDGGGDGFSWMDAQNWASDALPTAASDVQIDVPSRDIQVRIAGLAQAATVDCLESLRLIGSGSLTTSTLTELNIYVAGDLTIDSGGSINGYGLGYGPSTGPGGGATQYVGGGAGHGGSGGRGYDRLNHRYLNGGPAYG